MPKPLPIKGEIEDALRVFQIYAALRVRAYSVQKRAAVVSLALVFMTRLAKAVTALVVQAFLQELKTWGKYGYTVEYGVIRMRRHPRIRGIPGYCSQSIRERPCKVSGYGFLFSVATKLLHHRTAALKEHFKPCLLHLHSDLLILSRPLYSIMISTTFSIKYLLLSL